VGEGRGEEGERKGRGDGKCLMKDDGKEFISSTCMRVFEVTVLEPGGGAGIKMQFFVTRRSLDMGRIGMGGWDGIGNLGGVLGVY